MPTNLEDIDGADAQDRAETLDETHLTEDGEDIANFDDIDDVFDATQAEGDAEGDIDADEDALDDSEIADIEDDLETRRDDEGLDIEREPLDAIAGDDLDLEDSVSGDDDRPADFETDSLDEEDLAAIETAAER